MVDTSDSKHSTATSGDRIRYIRSDRSQETYADQLKIGLSTLRKYERNDRQPIATTLNAMYELDGVSSDWILRGVGPIYVSERTATAGNLPADENGFVPIPLYGNVSAAAGHGSFIDSEQVTDWLAFKREWIHTELNAQPKDLCLIMVAGESMEPTLRPGDTILVDRRDAGRIPRDGIYVIRMDHSLLVKRVQRLPGKMIKVTSDNDAYADFEVNLETSTDDIDVIGRAVWADRRL